MVAGSRLREIRTAEATTGVSLVCCSAARDADFPGALAER